MTSTTSLPFPEPTSSATLRLLSAAALGDDAAVALILDDHRSRDGQPRAAAVDLAHLVTLLGCHVFGERGWSQTLEAWSKESGPERSFDTQLTALLDYCI